jgi:hypothetical protein
MVGTTAPISRHIVITVDERAASDKLFEFAINQIYRVRSAGCCAGAGAANGGAGAAGAGAGAAAGGG